MNNEEVKEKNIEIRSASETGKFFSRVYGYLAMGIGISAFVSYLCLHLFMQQLVGFFVNVPFAFIGIWIAEIFLVYRLGSNALKNPTMAMGGYVGYSILNGITLSITLLMYTRSSVTGAFLSATLTFVVMAIVGVRTKKDLTAMGHALRSALIGIIISMLLNIFILHSTPVEMFISILMILIFSGITAYDHQMIKHYYSQVGNGPESKGIAVFCALQLYLNFINLFLAFLRLFGSKD